jgi:uncharacterized membrane protein
VNELITVLFGLTLVAALVVVVVRVAQGRASGRGARSEDAPRSEQERSQDRRTAMTWLLLVLVVIGALLLAYSLLGATS